MRKSSLFGLALSLLTLLGGAYPVAKAPMQFAFLVTIDQTDTKQAFKNVADAVDNFTLGREGTFEPGEGWHYEYYVLAYNGQPVLDSNGQEIRAVVWAVYRIDAPKNTVVELARTTGAMGYQQLALDPTFPPPSGPDRAYMEFRARLIACAEWGATHYWHLTPGAKPVVVSAADLVSRFTLY